MIAYTSVKHPLHRSSFEILMDGPLVLCRVPRTKSKCCFCTPFQEFDLRCAVIQTKWIAAIVWQRSIELLHRGSILWRAGAEGSLRIQSQLQHSQQI